MAKITFILPDGQSQVVEIAAGRSVMEGALDAGIAGIVAECGGCCTCGTCHCYVLPEWVDRLPPPTADEAGIIDFAWNPSENSRLSCQIEVTDCLDGLVVQMPERQ